MRVAALCLLSSKVNPSNPALPRTHRLGRVRGNGQPFKLARDALP